MIACKHWISFSFITLSVGLVAGCADPRAEAAASSGAAETTTSGLTREEALARLAGPFHGDWTMFGVDSSGAPKKVTHWTDTVTATAPTTAVDRITIESTDTMTFDGAPTPDCSAAQPSLQACHSWTEGYFLNADGSIGDRFVDQGGTITLEKEVAPNTFTMVETASPQELVSLGFTNASPGVHVTVKVVTTDGSINTERISRVTTVEWKDATGADRVTQMVTMQGQHQHAVVH